MSVGLGGAGARPTKDGLSTTAFRERGGSLNDIRAHLHANYVLSGAYRTIGARVALDAQLADPETGRIVWARTFKGNVALVKTDVLWDMEADAVFKKGWKENIDEWNKVGSDYPYHYLGSAKNMLAMGKAFGEAMLELRGESKK